MSVMIMRRRHGIRCSTHTCAPHRDGGADRGALSLVIVVMFVLLLALAGVVVDGGRKLSADENAVALAQEAARAGASTVDTSSAYSSGAVVVDQTAALAAARRYLVSAGVSQFTVTAVGARAIRVSVTLTQATKLLALIGIDSFACSGTATASLVNGVTGGA